MIFRPSVRTHHKGNLSRTESGLFYMVEEEHAIQPNLFVYTRFHSRNIPSDSQETSLQTYTHVFGLEIKMVEILTDLNYKQECIPAGCVLPACRPYLPGPGGCT